MREMKNSSVEWIGNIPAHWKIVPVKYVISISNGSDPLTQSGDTMVYGSGRNSFKTCEEYKQGPAVLLGRKGTINTPQWIEGRYWNVDTAFDAKSKNKNINLKLFYYLSICFDYRMYSTQTALPSMTQTNYNNMRIPFATIEEQQKIATYLDTKCAEIDSLISDIQQQIETLEQYKRSVITEAVTKGLDPDVEMRNSGIEWIGNVPENWELIRIGRLFSLRNERNYLPLDKVQLLSLYTGIGVFPHGEQAERGNKAVTADGYKIVHENDIVVNIILAWMGAIGISKYNGVTSPAYDVYIPNLKKVVPHFYHYVFRTQGIANECYKYGRGIMAMRWRTYSTEFKQIVVPHPDMETQQQIANYLDEKCSEIDSVIFEKKQQIETIEEYKKSLIFEYVTGKKEV